MHIKDLMAGIYYRLLYFLWMADIQKWQRSNWWITFSLASSKVECNEAFLAEIILYFIRNKGNYLTFLEFSQFRRSSILQQKEICEAYTFHIIYTIQCMKHKNNILLQIFDSFCIKTQKKNMENINVHRLSCRYSFAVSRLLWKVFSISQCLNPCPFQIDVTLLLYNIEHIRKARTSHKTFSLIVLSFKRLKCEIKHVNFDQIYWFLV